MADDPYARIAQLERELAAAREQQAGSAEVLRAIAGAPADLQSTLDDVAASAMRLTGSDRGTIGLREGEYVRIVSVSGRVGTPEAQRQLGELLDLREHTPGNVAVNERRSIRVPDRSTPEF